MKKVITIALLSGLAAIAPVGNTLASQNGKTFADWCENKERLTTEARHTVEVLLEGDKDCDRADRRLADLTSLYLSNKKS